MDKLKDPFILIDADILAYRAASRSDGREYAVKYDYKGQTITRLFKYKKEADKLRNELINQDIEDVDITQAFHPWPWKNTVKIIKDYIEDIHKGLEPYIEGTPTLIYYYSRSGSFRELEEPTYKSNRKGKRKPHHLEALKDHIRDELGGVAREGEFEADDLIAMEATKLSKEGENFVVVSIDKDLLQIPGCHYNFVKNEWCEVSEAEGLRSLYRQILTGDTADGIIGLKGIGPKKAEKLIDHLHTEALMYGVVIQTYFSKTDRLEGENDKDLGKRCIKNIRTAARLLYLVREEGKHWDAPNIMEVADAERKRSDEEEEA